MPNRYQTLFVDSFSTFKVFDDLILDNVSALPNAPKTIWQILNHLVKWQAYQLTQIKNIASGIVLNEDETWIAEQQPASQNDLDSIVAAFKDQQQQLANEIAVLDNKDPYLIQKLKIVQDLSVHLSFHVGEIILMRRMAGTYPLPHQMKAFLG